MRVLIVHNRYSSRAPSGENLAVDAEAGWLEDAGVVVRRHEVDNDEIVHGGVARRVAIAVGAAWSSEQARRLQQAIERERPDVVHVHNLFPILSASVPWAALRADLPVVWTVHNYRLGCVAGTRFRGNAECDLCHRGWRVPGVVFKCYGGSRSASVTTSVGVSIFRSLARRRLTTLAVSDHVRRWLLGLGFDPARTRTKHNAVTGPPTVPADRAPSDSRTLLYLGKLADEKGIGLLLGAWRRVGTPGARLRIVGSGLLDELVADEASRDPRIEVTGRVPRAEVAEHLFQARALVVPSLWQEPFPLSALDGLAHGRPIVTTGVGGLADIVDDSCGWTVPPDAASWAVALDTVLRSDSGVSTRGEQARLVYEAQFTPEVTTKALLDTYAEAIGGSSVP